MKVMKLFFACAITIATVPASQALAQVQTNVPDVVPGAKPATVEQIKIHGTALEGNLEGDAVDRDVIVFLPRATRKIRSADTPLSTRCTVTRLAPSSGRMKSTSRKRSKVRLQTAHRR
jgi:hypothetical protein